MPIPTLITDLSTTAASNYPAGSDSPANLDNVQRAHAAFIAQLRDDAEVLDNGLTTQLLVGGGAEVAPVWTTATGSGAPVRATSPVLETPALGTPSALVATNATGTATGLTAGISNALKSATTTVSVSAATAPTVGQVLTATSDSLATWQTVSSSLTVAVVTLTTQTAAAGTHYVLTNVAATTVTLPASPASGDTVWVTWTNTLSTNIIDRNAQTIMGVAENMTLDASTNGTVQLRFLNSSWRIL